jgi:hypothetical protein
MPYGIFLVDITNRIGSDERRIAIKGALQSYFNPIAKQAGIKDGALVLFVTEDPHPKNNELIAYYSSSGWHVVTEMRGAKVPADAEGGLTLWNGKVAASDIVADSTTDTTTIANLTFHELMHNKLGMGDEMHKLGGLARSPVDSSMRPTPDNIRIMSKHLNDPRPQWTGGVAELKARSRPIDVQDAVIR